MSFSRNFGLVFATAITLVLVAMATSACGGGSNNGGGGGANDVTPTQAPSGGASAAMWTQSFCTSAQAWKTSLRKAAATLKSAPHSRATANAALYDAKSATTLFAHELSTLGAPPGGQQAVQQLKLYGQRLRYDNQNLQGEWSASAANAQALAQKIETVRGTLLVMVGQLQQAAGYIRQLPPNSQLQKAFASNSTCRAVFGRS